MRAWAHAIFVGQPSKFMKICLWLYHREAQSYSNLWLALWLLNLLNILTIMSFIYFLFVFSMYEISLLRSNETIDCCDLSLKSKEREGFHFIQGEIYRVEPYGKINLDLGVLQLQWR